MVFSTRVFRFAWLPALLATVVFVPTLAHARPFYGPGSGGAIPDNSASGISSTVNVADNFAITSFDNLVVTGLNHTWVGDLVATLSHNGVVVDIFDRVGRTTTSGFGNSGDFTATSTQSYTFVASGGTNLPTTGNIAAGTYNVFANGTAGQASTATGTFSNFVGGSVGGAWTLNISDRDSSFTGSFTSWGFNATVDTTPPPPPPPGTYTGGLGGNITDATTDLGSGNVTPGITVSDIVVNDNFTISSFDSITIDGLVHSLVGDLTLQLEHVGTGTVVDLAYRLGQTDGTDPFDFGDDSNLNGSYTFSLTGASLLNAALQGNSSYNIAAGTYAASTSLDSSFANPNTLAAFAGQNVGGTWRLRIADSAEGDTGSFTGWGFKTTVAPVVVPETGTLALILSAFVVGIGLIRRKK